MSNWWNKITGVEGAQNKLHEGEQKVEGLAGQGVGALTTYGDKAAAGMEPYVKGGQQSYDLGLDTLGVHGVGARTAAQGLYNSDDEMAQQRALDLKRAGWGTNAAGFGGGYSPGGPASGTWALADSQTRLKNYDNWQSKLLELGRQGQQAAGTQGQFNEATGTGIAGVYGNESNALANLYKEDAGTQTAGFQSGINAVGAGASLIASMYGVPPVGSAMKGMMPGATRATNDISGSYAPPSNSLPYSPYYNPGYAGGIHTSYPS